MAPREEKNNPEPPDFEATLTAALKALPAEKLRDILMQAGAIPTTMGMDAPTLQSIVAAFQATSATAVRETLRQERRENPNYPERSVFNPGGVFDDQGKALTKKVTLRRPTYYNGVRLGGELETIEEIELCNRFTETRIARKDEPQPWEAIVEHRGQANERLLIKVPSKTIDDRMGLPTFTSILAELLGGAAAVDPLSLQRQIDDLRKQVESQGLTPAA